jgi:hypothetical protein
MKIFQIASCQSLLELVNEMKSKLTIESDMSQQECKKQLTRRLEEITASIIAESTNE